MSSSKIRIIAVGQMARVSMIAEYGWVYHLSEDIYRKIRDFDALLIAPV
jgi:hypothetical protein